MGSRISSIVDELRRVQDMLLAGNITHTTRLAMHDILGKVAAALSEEARPVMRRYHIIFRPTSLEVSDLSFLSPNRREALQGLCTLCAHVPEHVESVTLYEQHKVVAVLYFHGELMPALITS